jgi:hypothetical protein
MPVSAHHRPETDTPALGFCVFIIAISAVLVMVEAIDGLDDEAGLPTLLLSTFRYLNNVIA